MITELALQNFKSFKNLQGLNIKPITILCGTNSSGKSSILQSILLLKQTMESKNPNQTLLLNGRFAHLGNFQNIIFDKTNAEDMNISFMIKISKEDMRIPRENSPYPIYFILGDLISRQMHASNINNTRKYDFSIKFNFDLKSQKRIKKTQAFNPIIVNAINIDISYSLENKEEGGLIVKLQHVGDTKYDISSQYRSNNKNSEQNKKSGDSNLVDTYSIQSKVIFSNLIPRYIIPTEQNKSKTSDSHQLDFIFYRLRDLMQFAFSKYKYIGPLREEPARRYIYENEITEVGIKGENAAYLFHEESERPVNKVYFFNKEDNDFFEQKEPIQLGKAVYQWLDIMGIKNFKSDADEGIIHLKLDSCTTKKTQVNIADVGFGVSQVFPIVLEGIRMPIGSTLMLEQPEIHLHPNMQMQMADYLISLALSGKKVIVETHSDHLINRLVKRVVQDDERCLNDMISINFITPTPEGSEIEQVRIHPDSGIINWPVDFFDQTSIEQEAIMKAGLAKRIAKRKLSIKA